MNAKLILDTNQGEHSTGQIEQFDTKSFYEGVIRLAKSLALLAKQTRYEIAPGIIEDNHHWSTNLTPEEFADFFAQVITINPFAAACLSGKRITRKGMAFSIPGEIPIITTIFQYIANGPIPNPLKIALGKVMTEINTEIVLCKQFQFYADNTGKPAEDPFNLFCKTFFNHYDPAKREHFGIYNTPEPAVSFIVRSVHRLLKEKLRISDGLADDYIRIIEPAAGTASFLTASARAAADEYENKYGEGARGIFEKHYLSNQLSGFEIVITPYILAHLRIRLMSKPGQRFKEKDEPPDGLNLHLTDTLTLEPGEINPSYRSISCRVRQNIPVILGNPPYKGMSALPKKKSRIDKLVEDYWRIDGHRIDEKNLKSLKDDYVKFIRFCQWIIDENEEGVVGFITNHSYLDNPTFRGMRKSLMNSFDEIYILDLNGDAMRKNYQQNENEREGKDKNIFDIRQGVAISFFIKRSCRRPVQTYAFGDQERLIALWAGGAAPPGPPKIFYKEVKGAREKKLTCLSHNDITTIQWEEITPSWKFYSFKPSKQPTQNPTHKQDTYADFIRITDIFPIHSVGIVTARDQLCIQDNAEAVYKTINEFSTITESEARVKFNLGNDSRDWRIKEAQKDIIESGTDRGKIVPILYRPFDTRYTYYTGNSRGFICMPRPGVMKHLLKKNIGLITVRQSVEGNFTHCFAAETLVESRVCTSNRGICHVFPLYLYEADTVIPNISPGFIDMLRKEKGFTIAPAPQQLFNYVYAVLSSNVYRKQYEGYLKIDFPALPIPCDFRLFIEMAKLGERLVALHLMNSVELNDTTARFEGKGSNRVEMIEYSAGNGKPGMVYINKEQYFSGVQEEEWDYILNGYQVMDKWLRLRRGKTLSVKEITHFIRVVRIIRLTIQYQKLIDEKYPMIEQTIVSNK